jgi:hypothetical protein
MVGRGCLAKLIWATRFKEKKEKVKTRTAGGKNATGTVGSGKDAKTVKYTYFAIDQGKMTSCRPVHGRFMQVPIALPDQ